MTNLWYSIVEGRGMCVHDLRYADGGLSPLDMEYECDPLAVQRVLVEVAVDTGSQNVTALATQLPAVNARSERIIEGLLVPAESDRGDTARDRGRTHRAR